MWSSSLLLVLSLLCSAGPVLCILHSVSIPGLAQQTVSDKLDSISLVPSIVLGSETRRDATPPGVVRTQECLDVPDALSVLGIGSLCAELDLIGCDNQAKARISMEGSAKPLYEIAIDPNQHETCISAQNMSESPLHVCGMKMEICLSFLDVNGVSTLHIEESSLSACPTLIIKKCTPPWPLAPMLPDLPLVMPCTSRSPCAVAF